MKTSWTLSVFILILVAIADGQTRIVRFPDIHRDRVVFVYGGDLWTVSSQGGNAIRLTSHPGLELFPKFSPDGKWIAFTGEYDGTGSVYVIPAQGGEPRRLTWRPARVTEFRHGHDYMVIDWSPDGNQVLFRSWRRSFNAWLQQLFRVPVSGGLPQMLALPECGLASFSGDGKRIAYNRIFRDFRTWKRYRGGLAQDIWLYDFASNQSQRLTNWPGTDHCPLWHGESIYFISDRNGRANIFRYDLPGKKIEQITTHQDYDVKWPGLGPQAIVYENGGLIYRLDLATRQTRPLAINVPGERRWRRQRFVNAADNIEDYKLSPDGKQALFVARGDVFTVPAKKGIVKNLTRSSGAREKYASYSPDGKWICYVSDSSDEDEIYLRAVSDGHEIRLTTKGDRCRLRPRWSPDSKKIAFADKSHRLFYLDIANKKLIRVDSSEVWEINHYRWSPDSRWLVYSKIEKNQFASLYIYSLVSQKIRRITSTLTNESNPVFDSNGKYLYFISHRAYSAMLGRFDRNYVSRRISRIYVLPLTHDQKSPFAPQQNATASPQKEDADQTRPALVKIDFSGIQTRSVAVPVPADNYHGLLTGSGQLFYLSSGGWVMGRKFPKRETQLHRFNLKTKKAATVISGISGYALSANGKKILYRAGKTFGIVASGGKHQVGAGKIDLQGLRVKISPGQEWQQIFAESWRLQRDYFYAPNMHGVNWPAVKAKYQIMIPHVAHRDALNYVIGEMIGELCCSHTYVGGGDYPAVDRVATGLLGARFELDRQSGCYRFAEIYPGQNWNDQLRSPLTRPGVHVKRGDYLLAVNGVELRATDNPYSLLEGHGDDYVELKIAGQPDAAKTRTVRVRTLTDEMPLIYWNWVESNRRYVSRHSAGSVGYLHIPDMSEAGLLNFIKYFYGQVRKQGLIIDVRYNGGGFVSQMLLERLRRVLIGMGQSRNGTAYTYPQVVFHGHMLCLINSYSASDGDIFPYYFRQYQLGKLLGTTSWGGVVGIRGQRRLLDGGYVTVPEFAPFNLQGEWIMENQGVKPDIIVDNLPHQVIAGEDPQLQKGLAEILRQIAAAPKKLPKRPANYPVR